MNPANARDMLLTTDYPIDVVVSRISGSTYVPQATNMSESVFITIDHDLGYAPLCIGTWSEDSSFAPYYKFGSSPRFFNPFFQYWSDRASVSVQSTVSQLGVSLMNWSNSKTIYWRISMLAPSNAGLTPTPAASDRQPLYINTDLNLMKVYDAGYFTQSIGGSGFATRTIPHGLGIIPVAVAWSELEGTVRSTGNENAVGATGLSTALRVDTDNLYIDFESFVHTSAGLHYKIYLD